MLTLVTALALFVQTTDGDPLREVEKLRREVEMLRGLNDLQLTREQMHRIVQVSEEIRAERAKAVRDAGESITAMKDALRELRDALRTGGKGAREAEKSVREVERAAGESMRAVMQSSREAVGKLKEILTEKQREKVARLGRPDPNRGLRNMFAGIIERVREENDREVDERLVEMVFRQVERLADRMELSEDAVEEEVDRIVGIVDEAIDAEDDDYEKNRDAYLERIFGEGKLGEAAKKRPGRPAGRPEGRRPAGEEGPGQGRPNPADRRLAEIFLNPDVIKVLKERLAKED